MNSRALALVVAVFASGCMSVGPDYEEPEADIQSAWIDGEDERLASSADPAPDWWRAAFADAELDALVARSLDDNLTLRSAGLRVLQSQQQLAIAVGNQYPQSQSATGTVANEKAQGRSEDAYSLGAQASWELDFWGRFQSQIDSAAAVLDASVADYDTVMVSLIAQVAQTYISVRTTQQRIAALDENIRLQRRALEITQAKVRAGAVTELDADQAETLLYNTEAQRFAFETSLQQLKNALAILLGQSPQELSYLLAEPGAIPTTQSDAAIGMPQDLIRRRPDIRSAERLLAAQSAQIGFAVTELYPHFVINGSIGTAAGRTDDLFGSNNETWLLGAGFEWNLFNYGRLRSNVRLQDALFQQQLIDYRNTVLQAQGDVENALVAYLKSADQLQAYVLAAEAARRALKISTAQYLEGEIDFNRVISTLQTSVQQEDFLAATRGSVANNLVQVYRAIGGGWEVRGEVSPVDLLPETTKDEMRERTPSWDATLR